MFPIKKTTQFVNKKILDKWEYCKKLDMYVDKINKTITETWEKVPLKAKNKKQTGFIWWNELVKLKSEVAAKKRRIKCASQIRRKMVIEHNQQAKEH